MVALGLVQSAAPSAIWRGSASGLSFRKIGTGTWPDWALMVRSTVCGSV